MAVEFGATPWGRAWLRTIESTSLTAPNPLLPKARSLARNNGVTALTAETGHIEAEVIARGTAHRVHIGLPRWDEQQEFDADGLISDAQANNGGLAPGDLPDSLESDLTRHNIDIAVPTGEQTTDCACTDRRTHCVHVLAALYTLVQRIDENPALAVALRSRSREPDPRSDPDWIHLTDVKAAGFYRTG